MFAIVSKKVLAEVREETIKSVKEEILPPFGEAVKTAMRAEYTVMPRFGFHQPLDYDQVTLPAQFDPVIKSDLSSLLLPGGKDRFGYSPDDDENYLRWGRQDHDLVISAIEKWRGKIGGVSILDFGCSSGRVLRHFEEERLVAGWQLYGCDIQARAVEWMRRYLPQHFNVITSSTLPHLPYEDKTFDVIYGFSVFTHVKYQWDAWLMELRRILKPGGLLIQTIHAETAWSFYHNQKHESWVRESQCPRVYDTPEMDVDYLYYGDACVSQVFWKKDIAVDFWGRYFKVLEFAPPPKHSFQDWIICQKS